MTTVIHCLYIQAFETNVLGPEGSREERERGRERKGREEGRKGREEGRGRNGREVVRR